MAVHALGMDPAVAEQTNPADLEAMLSTLESRPGSPRISGATAPTAPTAATLHAMTDSEITLLPRTMMQARQRVHANGTPQLPSPQPHIKLEESKELLHLREVMAPIDVHELCVRPKGLLKLNEKIKQILEIAEERNQAIARKRQVILTTRGIFDMEDVADIRSTIAQNIQELRLIVQWLSQVADELDQLIRQRLDAIAELDAIQEPGSLATMAKLRTKTMQIRTYHEYLTSRRDCLLPATESMPEDDVPEQS